jgi:hypothetical protein
VRERFLLPEDADAFVRAAQASDVLVGVGEEEGPGSNAQELDSER